MKNTKKIKCPVKLNLDNYVNLETGELLSSEVACNKENIRVTTDSDLVTITSDNYIIIDSMILSYIKSKLSSSDFQRLMCMSNLLKTEFNIVFNNTIHHTPDTLSKELEISQDDLKRMVNRLVKIGVLAYVVSHKSGIQGKIFMINPTFARKRKTFHKDLLEIFDDLSKL